MDSLRFAIVSVRMTGSPPSSVNIVLSSGQCLWWNPGKASLEGPAQQTLDCKEEPAATTLTEPAELNRNVVFHSSQAGLVHSHSL